MKKLLLLTCMALMSLFGAKATVMPTTSTAGNDVWYYIKCSPRQTVTNTWLTGADNGGDLHVAAFTGGDEQLWKVVINGSGVALVNKAYGTYMNSDLRDPQSSLLPLTSISSTPTTALRLISCTRTDPWTGWDGKNGIYIVDVNVTDQMALNNTTLAADAATHFTFYAAGSGSNFRPIVYYRNSCIITHSAVVFMTAKEILADKISSGNITYNNSSVGPNPGQFSTDDATGLKDAIDAAQLTYDDATATDADYLAAVKDLNSIILFYNSAVILPKVSDSFNEYWYFFQGTRPANTYMTSSGAGGVVKDLAVIPDDTQLWKLVNNGDGLAFVNKSTGEYINTDLGNGTSAVSLSTQALAPAKALTFKVSPEVTNKVSRFYIENVINTANTTVNFRMHAGGSGNGYELLNWTGSATDNCSWLIMDYAAVKRDILKNNLADAKTIIATTQIGNNPGQVTQTVMDEFKAIVATQQAVYDDPDKTSDDYMAAGIALADAKAALKTKANVPVISTDANTVWYTLSGTRPATTSVIYSNSADSLKYQVLKQNDSELWRFVANGTGVAIQNKATMKYVACDSVDGSQLVTQTAMPATPLKFVVTDQIAQGAFRFLIVNDAATQPWGSDLTFNLHAAAASPMNYLDPTDNSAWLIADNSQTIRNAYSTLFASAKILYASTLYSFNLLSESAKTAMTNAVNTARADSANFNNMSYAQLQTAYQTFSDAVTAFNNSRINSLVSTSANPKWIFVTGCNSTATAGYNTRIANVNSQLRGVAKNDTDSAQMWRFELNADNTTVRMINAKAPHDEASLTGQSGIGSLVAAGGGTSFTFKTHSDGVSTIIAFGGTPVHCDGSKQIVGWYDTTNPNSAWRFDVAGATNAVKNTTVTKYRIHNTNGVITVEGVTSFEVYSIMGQRMNNKTVLGKGVYIVKIGNETQKYIVR